MNNMRMIVKNLWDEATLTVATGTPISTLPLTHSQTYGRSKTAAITPDTDTTAIKFECSELSLASGLVLYRHWLSSTGLWRLELFNEPDLTGDCVFDSGLIELTPTKTLGELDWLVDPLVSGVFDNWPHKYSQLWFPEVFFQSGRLTLIDSDGRDGLHEFDRVYLGAAFSPQFNFSYSFKHQWVSSEEQRKTAAGSTFSAQRPQARKLEFNLDYLTENERSRLSRAIQTVGVSKDFFISLYPEQGGQKEVEYAMACFFSEVPPLTGDYFNNYNVPFVVQEA